MSIKFIVDDNIPFIKGRLEPFAEVVYVDQFGFTPELVKNADALLIRTRTRCDKKLLDGSNVKLIATATIGMDQIDLDYCAEKGIIVRNSPGCNAPAVAQYVWSSLLRCGFNPATQTLGIIGCGNVGTIVAEWGQLLGARILVNDPPRSEKGDYMPRYCDLEKLLKESDAVTLHTPLTSGGKHPTYHLFGKQQIDLLKPGAILVNAARGPVIDTPCVVDALRERKIRVIIDTWEGEPQMDIDLFNLAEIATFHIAGYSLEGKQRATRMVLEAVAEVFGINPDTTGLSAAYYPKKIITETEIISSYNPKDDMRLLRDNPCLFDTLRRNYKFRKEV